MRCIWSRQNKPDFTAVAVCAPGVALVALLPSSGNTPRKTAEENHSQHDTLATETQSQYDHFSVDGLSFKLSLGISRKLAHIRGIQQCRTTPPQLLPQHRTAQPARLPIAAALPYPVT
jgi:hypothetical protein